MRGGDREQRDARGTVYELNRLARREPELGAAVAAPLGVAAGIAWVVTRETGMAVVAFMLLAVAAWAAVVAWYRPQRVELTDAGMTVRARAGDETIPWGDLTVVGLYGSHSRHGPRLFIGRAGAADLDVCGAFENVHAMLTEIERRAPHARVSSYVHG